MRVLRWLPPLTVLLTLGIALPVVAQHQHAARPISSSPHRRATRSGASNDTRKRRSKPVHHAPALATLTVDVGYDGLFRDSAWVPVRVTAHNRTSSTISGTLEIPDPSSNNNFGPPMPYRSLYQMPIVLAGGVTKIATLYLPSSSVSSGVDVQLRWGGRVLADAVNDPSSFGQANVSVGALTADPASISWINQANSSTFTNVSLVRLTPRTFDPLPQALANFDIIVIHDDSAGALDRDQLSALDRYVRNGGALVLVGGPGWQQALRPLPADLVPGAVSGSATLSNLLAGLSTIQRGSPRREAATVVSVLHDPQGRVLASAHGIPLVVQHAVGQGQVMYMAFDPALDPIAHWSRAGSLLTTLFLRAAPSAATRADLPQGSPPPSIWVNPYGPENLAGELSNVPAAALPSILLFLVLTLVYIVLLGPANFLVLRRLHRPELLWLTIPAGALLCLGATFGIAFQLKGSTVLVNSIGMVTLDGANGHDPASLYMGLFAPVSGNYNLTFDSPALPEYVPNFNYYGGPLQQTGDPLGLRFQEGAQTDIQFIGMNMWSMRDAAIHTTVNIPGTVRSKLHIDRNGYIVGAVHNDTPLALIHPAIIAGNTIIHLADMPPEKTVRVRVKPDVNVFTSNNYQPIWYKMYGQPQYGGPVFVGRGPFGACVGGCGLVQGGGPCCYNPNQMVPQERSFADRARNAVTQIPDAQDVSSLGEVVFVAWNQQPLGSIRVDGASPQRRDLNLIAAPLSVGFAPGPFRLRTGTFGARLVNVVPQAGTNGGCCCCGPTDSHPIDIAAGGSATFEFDLPSARYLHFKDLWLQVNAGGADGTDLGRVWDWRASRWVMTDLSSGTAHLRNPARFISSTGTLLLELVPTDYSTDVRIVDVHSALQVSGDGMAT